MSWGAELLQDWSLSRSAAAVETEEVRLGPWDGELVLKRWKRSPKGSDDEH